MSLRTRTLPSSSPEFRRLLHPSGGTGQLRPTAHICSRRLGVCNSKLLQLGAPSIGFSSVFVASSWLSALIDAWCGRRQRADSALGARWWRAADVAAAAHHAVLRQWCVQLRKACRDDRAAHFSRLADKISSGPTEEVFHNLHALLGHRRKKPYRPEPLPALRRADGSLCSDGDETLARWRQHFGALEAGRELCLPAFMAGVASGIQSSRTVPLDWPLPDSILELPTEVDIQRLLVAAKAGKAPGPDGIPAEFGRRFAKYLAPHLHRIVLKTTLRGSEPIGFKSGQAI